MLKIAHIIESTSGGSARAAIALAAETAKQGHDVTFIYSPLRADSVFEADLNKLKVTKKIPLFMKRAVGLHDLWDALRLYRILKREGPFDIVHAHSSKAGALTRMVQPFIRKGKLIYTAHGFITMGKDANPLYAKIEKWLAPLADKVITVSHYEHDHAHKDIGIPENKLVLIPNGLTFAAHATRGEARSRMRFSEQTIVLGFVGRFSEEKNPLRLIRAFAPLARNNKHVHLAILGKGPLLNEMIKQIDLEEMGDQIRMWHDQEARFFMPGFDALICSSNNEGLPLVFIEALQDGIPLISTPVGGTAECVIQGKTGFVAEGFEVEHLTDAITSFLSLPAMDRKKMNTAAKDHSIHFSVQQMTEKTLSLYQNLLD